MTKPVFLKTYGYHQQPSSLHKLYSTDSPKKTMEESSVQKAETLRRSC